MLISSRHICIRSIWFCCSRFWRCVVLHAGCVAHMIEWHWPTMAITWKCDLSSICISPPSRCQVNPLSRTSGLPEKELSPSILLPWSFHMLAGPEFKDDNKCEHLTCLFSWTFSCFLHGSMGQKNSTCANSNQKVCNCYFTFIKNKVYQKNMSSLGYASITLTNWKKIFLNFTHFSIVCCLPHS